MSDILERLLDLHKQATTEQTHYYVSKCCLDSIAEIVALRLRLADAEALLQEARQNWVFDSGPSGPLASRIDTFLIAKILKRE